jgi:hypothetical protein
MLQGPRSSSGAERIGRPLAGVQDEEQEAEEGPPGRNVVRKQLAGGIRRGRWFADDRYPEASGGEGVGHRVQRPVPETHQRGLAARGPLGGQVGGRKGYGRPPDPDASWTWPKAAGRNGHESPSVFRVGPRNPGLDYRTNQELSFGCG